METLHEFSLATQAGEYLVGLLGLILFVPLWRLVTRPAKTPPRSQR